MWERDVSWCQHAIPYPKDSGDPKFFGTSNSDQTLHVIELANRKVISVTKMLMCNLFAVANLCFCLLLVLLMLAALNTLWIKFY